MFAKFVEKRFLGPGREMKASQFALLPAVEGETVFLGDSITAGGQWQEWFPGVPLRNRGIDGDKTTNVLARLDVALRADPSRVFLLIGTNDISFGHKDDEITDNVRTIVQRTQITTPHTEVYVQSIMPRRAKQAPRIRKLNAEYKRIAEDQGVTFIDLWPALSAGDELRPGYTLDSLHLTGAGYRAWAEVLEPLLSVQRPLSDRALEGAIRGRANFGERRTDRSMSG
ncbi:Lysophospholipase L1 [Microbacterium sp. cf046]|uniref:GDSL-type esterase/lipase family protein n=1 Tax=Microbacterium sp. cf046 TaxID=1761803 RepID=UPI0008EFD274|nr:GDSL-type esterase/lipase family protein [Microbacterium sp. cf046]SFS16930.1 Lysophospholipase L1 [Microbacterium sp. cf046]